MHKFLIEGDASFADNIDGERNIFPLIRLVSEARKKKYVGQIKGRHIWCEEVRKDMAENATRVNTMMVVCHSRPNEIFEVLEFRRPDKELLGDRIVYT